MAYAPPRNEKGKVIGINASAIKNFYNEWYLKIDTSL